MTTSFRNPATDTSQEILLNADRATSALVHGADIAWIPSPQAGVDRRMLERVGGEVALATSIVSYAPNSEFPSHTHDLGEEFLVLDGTFSDSSGDFSAGAYVRNPPNSKHAPFSRDGCVIFVKLRQMLEDESESVRVLPSQLSWQPTHVGSFAASLYDNGRIAVQLLRLAAGTVLPERRIPNGEEMLVVDGSVVLNPLAGCDSKLLLRRWSWYRHPGTVHASITTDTGALLWVKRGHL